jgi:hypothetical protein
MVGHAGEDRHIITRCLVIVFFFSRRPCALVLPVSRMPREKLFHHLDATRRRASVNAF